VFPGLRSNRSTELRARNFDSRTRVDGVDLHDVASLDVEFLDEESDNAGRSDLLPVRVVSIDSQKNTEARYFRYRSITRRKKFGVIRGSTPCPAWPE